MADMAEIDLILNQEHLGENAKEVIRTQLADEASRDNFINDYNSRETADVFMNYVDFYSDIRAYTDKPKNDYGTGTRHSVSTLISYQTAQDNSIGFYDPAFAHFGDASIINDSLASIPEKTLMLGNLLTEKNRTLYQTDTLKELLAADNLKNFEKVIIPLSLIDKDETKPDGVKSHSVSLVLSPQENKFVLIDQGGKNDGYDTIKDKIRNVLSNAGYTGIENQTQVVRNRMDCAIFATMINEAAVNKTPDELLAYAEELTQKPDNEVQQQVDDFNEKCKSDVQTALWAQYKNNPVFKLYLQAKNIDFDSLSFQDKQNLFDSFLDNGTLNVNTNTNDDQINDPAWKDEVREAMRLASEERQSDFQEYQDPEHPEKLCFRNSETNNIVFSSRNQVQVEGEQEAFDTLVLSAKKMNMTKINFGKFEQHPEYKARLYLACLKYGMNMIGNVPSQEELQQYSGEYAEIQKLLKEQNKEKTKAEIQKEYNESEDSFKAASQAFETASRDSSNPLSNLVGELKAKQQEARKPENRENQTLKDEIAAKKEEIKATPEGKALFEAVEKKSALYQKALDAGLIKADKLKEHKKTTHKGLTQKEGESNEDFAERQKEWNRNRSDTHKFKRELNREVINHALKSRNSR